ncbi:MAG: hypothetical protein LBB78_03075 [Spirochaetaceae bacterium]|jgi:hypothetical protein|nr:hypothetical protein [Spirochaetaceae bacterium]
MANKNRLARGFVFVLVCGLAIAGCDGVMNTEKGYTFKFKVDNNTSQTITKLEFINGDTRNDNVLSSSSESVSPGKRSMQFIVSGFTVDDYDDGTRIFGVKATFEDGSNAFGWSYAGHEEKILASVYSYGVFFRRGNW